MPRRNLMIILSMAAISLACYHKTIHSRTVMMFDDAYSKIENRFLFVNHVSEKELADGAIKGMIDVVHKIDDNTVYMPSREAKNFQDKHIDQKMIGVGIQIREDKKTNLLLILSVIANSPAEKAGLKIGDRILKIDQFDAKLSDEFNVKDAQNKIMGPLGKNVTLVIARKGFEKPLTFIIKRGNVKLDSVKGENRVTERKWNYQLPNHPNITYVRLSSFGKNTHKELRKAIENVGPENIKALVLDMRFNGGGLLDAAYDICNLFVNKSVHNGTIVSIEGRHGSKHYQATNKNTFTQFPIAILINEASASASEIVAACLQDHGRAVIVGTHSYGKGTVQNLITLVDGKSVLKLTVARFIRPNGKNIHKTLAPVTDPNQWGVYPNEGLEVKLKKEEIIKLLNHLNESEYVDKSLIEKDPKAKPFVDRQLEKAVQFLENKLKK